MAVGSLDPPRSEHLGTGSVRHSVLFPGDARPAAMGPGSEILRDLYLDQIFEALLADRGEYALGELLRTPLHDPAVVAYRQDAVRDLEDPGLAEPVAAFAERMRAVRSFEHQATKMHHPHERRAWRLSAVAEYCGAVEALAVELDAANLRSEAFLGLRRHLAEVRRDAAFVGLADETRSVRAALAGITYTVHIKGNRVTVNRYGGQADYSARILETFDRFKQGATRDYRVAIPKGYGLNHVEARILELVARLHPQEFAALSDHEARHRRYVDPTIAAFDREVQLYLAYLGYIAPLRAAGLSFCYPTVSTRMKDERVDGAFDLALAAKLVSSRSPVVTNGYRLTAPERIIVVTGPNQGGKSTFARMVGQLHYLASLGLPVPGVDAGLFLPDRLFTHFEREEDVRTLRGKLEDELLRMRDIIRAATGDSLIVVNESLTSTTLSDAVALGTEVLGRIDRLGALGVWVTFVDELASLSEATISMMSTVDPADPAVRTFRVERKPADGRAYALAIAAKYGLTYEALRARDRR